VQPVPTETHTRVLAHAMCDKATLVAPAGVFSSCHDAPPSFVAARNAGDPAT
jgi:hypothetical protein